MDTPLKDNKCDNASALLKQSFTLAGRPDYGRDLIDQEVLRQFRRDKEKEREKEKEKEKEKGQGQGQQQEPVEVEKRVDHLTYKWEKKMGKMMLRTRQKEADMKKLELKRFPYQLCYLSKNFLVKLDISKNRITSLKDLQESGRGVFEGMKFLQELNLSFNLLTEVPHDISRLTKVPPFRFAFLLSDTLLPPPPFS